MEGQIWNHSFFNSLLFLLNQKLLHLMKKKIDIAPDLVYNHWQFVKMGEKYDEQRRLQCGH